MAQPQTISFLASDVSGQKQAVIDDAPLDATIGDLIESVVPKMDLPRNDVEGRPLTYNPLNETAGRHLHALEKIGDSIQPEDHIVFQPNVDAG